MPAEQAMKVHFPNWRAEAGFRPMRTTACRREPSAAAIRPPARIDPVAGDRGNAASGPSAPPADQESGPSRRRRAPERLPIWTARRQRSSRTAGGGAAFVRPTFDGGVVVALDALHALLTSAFPRRDFPGISVVREDGSIATNHAFMRHSRTRVDSRPHERQRGVQSPFKIGLVHQNVSRHPSGSTCVSLSRVAWHQTRVIWDHSMIVSVDGVNSACSSFDGRTTERAERLAPLQKQVSAAAHSASPTRKSLGDCRQQG